MFSVGGAPFSFGRRLTLRHTSGGELAFIRQELLYDVLILASAIVIDVARADSSQ